MIQLENIVLSPPVPKSFFSLVTGREEGRSRPWSERIGNAGGRRKEEARSLEGNETDETAIIRGCDAAALTHSISNN